MAHEGQSDPEQMLFDAGNISVTTRLLRVNASTISLSHVTSVTSHRTARRAWWWLIGPAVLACVALMAFGMWVERDGYWADQAAAKATTQEWKGFPEGQHYTEANARLATSPPKQSFGRIILFGLAGIGLTAAVRPKPATFTHGATVNLVSSSPLAVTFPDQRSCVAFCAAMEQAMASAGAGVSVDARQVHVHNPPPAQIRQP